MRAQLFVLTSVIAGLLATEASATPIIGSLTGLAAPAATVDFGTSGDTDTPITTEFEAQGVTFSSAAPEGGLYLFPFPGVSPQTGHNVGNFTSMEFTGIPEFTINFTADQTGAAFLMLGFGETWIFEALSGASVVESFSAFVGFDDPILYYGFSGITFDAIRLIGTSPVDFFTNIALIDNIQLSVEPPPPPPPPPPGVPSPGALALMGFGLVGLIGSRRRVNT